MKIGLISLIVVALCAGIAGAQEKAATPPVDTDMAAYSFGFAIGSDMKTQGLDMNPDPFLKGMRDGLTTAKPPYSETQMRDSIRAFQQEMRAKQEKRRTEQAEKNKKDGDAFLAANKKKEGVISTASGLQYKILKEGTGKQPKADDTVTVHYRGALVDGTEFDSSISRGSPATFPVSGVIKGWTEALQLMKVGAKWQVVLPPDIAYGPNPAGPKIGPNSTLVFEVELLSIEEEKAPAEKAPEK